MGLQEATVNLLAQIDGARLGKQSQADREFENSFFRKPSKEGGGVAPETGNLEWRKKFAELQGKSLTERELQVFLEDVPWGKIAREGTGVLAPLLTGVGLGKVLTFEQTQQLIEIAFSIGAGALSISSLCAANEMLSRTMPKTARLARIFAAGKVVSLAVAKAGTLLTAGAFGGGAWRAMEMANAVRAANEQNAALNSFFGADGQVGPPSGGANLPLSPDRDLRGQPDIGQPHFGGVGADERGGIEVIPQPPAAPDASPQIPSPDSPMAPAIPEDLQLPKPPEINVQEIVDSLPKHVGVAQLPAEQQIGASHWRLAEAWSQPLAKIFGLEDPARTFLTDAIKDLTQDQGAVRMDTVVNYNNHQIGDYLAEALARLKETNPAGWEVKVSAGDVDRLQKIADFLKNSK